MAATPRDPNLADDPSRGITPPGTTMKARPQRERILQGLVPTVIILAVFIGFVGKPAWDSLQKASAQPAATATPYAYATPSASPTGGDVASIIAQQGQNIGNQADSMKTAALRKLGAGAYASPTPSPGPPGETQAQHDARVAAEVKQSYDDLNNQGSNGGGGGSGSPFGYNIVSGYNPPLQQQQQQQQQPPPTPVPVLTPQPPGPRIQGLIVTTVTPPPRAPAAASTPAATASSSSENSNPYNRGGVFVPGPSGINYVGVEPGQNSGQLPQTPGQMRVASQASFLSSGGGNIYSTSQEAPAPSWDEIYPNHKIHWVPDVDIVSTLPGNFTGHVTEDVVSNLPIPCGQDICAHELLIPNGTNVSGTYNADVQAGDDRIQCHITLLIFPNGNTLQVSDTQGSDLGGANGLKADVNNHVGRIYTVTLIGALVNGIGNAIALRTGITAPYSLGAAAAQGFGQQIAQSATTATTNQLQQPPTLTVRAGTVQTFSFSQIQPLVPYRKTTEPTHE